MISSINEGSFKLTMIIIVCFGLLLRVLTGLGPYSGTDSVFSENFFPQGYNNPPDFGDYEAQRHWLELTFNTPMDEWYTCSPVNNLSYWRLDYPPLTAYHSLFLGHLSHIYENKSVEILTSHGYETPSHKFFMRATVLFSDLIIFISAVLAFIYYSISK